MKTFHSILFTGLGLLFLGAPSSIHFVSSAISRGSIGFTLAVTTFNRGGILPA